MNGGNPREELIEHKNPELAMKLEHTNEWEQLSVNHLEGRTAACYCYGDGGGDEVADFVNAKGKAQPGKYRAFRHQSPGPMLADAKLAWSSIRMKFGMPPEGSSPTRQQDAGLNQDATLSPKKGEGEKLRDE